MPLSHYETSDIYLAAYLLSQGATFVNCRRVGPRRNVFSFAADEKLHELLRLYWMNGPMTLVPGQLFAALRRLKSLSRLRPQETGEHTDDGRNADAGTTDAGERSMSPSDPFPSLPC
jgi:hypothetical protein